MPRLKCACGRSIPYDPDEAGRKVRCPACKKSLVIPDDDEDEDLDDEEESGEESAPGKRGKAKPGGVLVGMGTVFFSMPGAVLILIAVTIGAGLMTYGIYEYRLSSGASAEPSPARCADVIARGVPANPNVTLTDFQMAGNYLYVLKVPKSEVEKVKGGGMGSSGPSSPPWTKAYVPLLPWNNKPAGATSTPTVVGSVPAGGEIRLLLVTSEAKSAEELEKAVSGNRAKGLLGPASRWLDGETREEIAKAYAGIDFDKVLVLQEGRQPSSPAFTALLIAGGTLFLALAIGMAAIGVLYHSR